MRSAWRFHSASERAVPVEMRFVDMFMAALGSLIFMAMLLAFLLRYLPDSPGRANQPDRTPSAAALQIATRLLPPARVGEPYELAFAYRGGAGPVAWQVPAGLREIPAGLRFDPQRGVLSGTPGARATARFVVQVTDARGATDRRPLELVIEAPKKGSRKFETWFAAIGLVLLLLFWLATLGGISEFRQRLATLEEAWAQGQPSVTWRRGMHEQEIIRLPAGIEIYQERLQSARWFSRFMLLILLSSVAWFAWRVWGG